jgi:putative Mn2+ efflux pump MntP
MTNSLSSWRPSSLGALAQTDNATDDLALRSLRDVGGDTAKLIAFVVPLGIDTFGVALALGIAGLPTRLRTRIALLFATFEAAMPLVGVIIGAGIGRAIGEVADYAAAGVVIALGAYMLLADDDADGERLLSLTRQGVRGAIVLGLTISLDELAIGFSAGLLRLPLVPLIVTIAAQAFVVTEIGLRVGRHVGNRWQESAERIAGVALIALGLVLFATTLASTG